VLSHVLLIYAVHDSLCWACQGSLCRQLHGVQCLQGAKDDDMDMDVDDEPMRIVRNYQRHDAR